MTLIKGENVAINVFDKGGWLGYTLVFFLDEHKQLQVSGFLDSDLFKKGHVQIVKRGNFYKTGIFEEKSFRQRLVLNQNTKEITNQLVRVGNLSGQLLRNYGHMILKTKEETYFKIYVDGNDVVVECKVSENITANLNESAMFGDLKKLLDDMFDKMKKTTIYFSQVRSNVNLQLLQLTRKVNDIIEI